jgi:protein TonB
MVMGLLAAAVVAATGDPAPVVIIQPHWRARPNGDDIAKAYPDRAQNGLISGRAELACLVTADGRLEHCRVHEERRRARGSGRQRSLWRRSS